MKGFGVLLLPLALLLAACGGGNPAATPAPGPAGTPQGASPTPGPTAPTPLPTGFRVEVIARRLEVPWALAFAPDGRLFFTERPGHVRVIKDGQLQPQPWVELPVAQVGEGGLLGLALDPNFGRNGYVYVYYTYRAQGGLQNRVARLRERDGRGAEATTILDGIPGANIHDGGRIKFGPDGKLYIGTGDASQSALAQDPRSLAGKVLRLNPDGSIPSDNPFPGSPVYSLGHRNPQGLAWHPQTGQLFETEHGPSANDEVNIVQAGKNYGWPQVGELRDPRFVDPVLWSRQETWAPAGAAFYDGDRLPFWRGSLLFAALRGEHLHRVILRPPDFTSVERDEELLSGQYGRLRDVVVGPDGLLYIATSNRDGRGSPAAEDDRILRLVPAGP